MINHTQSARLAVWNELCVKNAEKPVSRKLAGHQAGHNPLGTSSQVRPILSTSDFTKSNYFQNRSVDATAAAAGCTFDATAAAAGRTVDVTAAASKAQPVVAAVGSKVQPAAVAVASKARPAVTAVASKVQPVTAAVASKLRFWVK